MKKIKITLLTVTISLLFCGCVDQDDYDRMKNDFDRLENQIDTLESDNEALKVKNQEQAEYIKELEAQINNQPDVTEEEIIIDEEIEDVEDNLDIPSDVEYRTDITFDDLSRKPGDYEGEYVEFSGEVIQLSEYDDEIDLRVATASNGYDDVVYVVYEPDITSERILEDDKITFRGVYYGIYQYESTAGALISIPLIIALEVERN